MIRLLFIFCLIGFGMQIGNVNASSRLGISWFSVSEQLGGPLVLQVDHIFLGAGDRKAFYELFGCTEEPLWLEVPVDENGMRWSSEIELASCDFNEPLTLSLYFEESDGEVRRVQRITEVPRHGLPETNNVLPMCNERLGYSIDISPQYKGKDLTLSYYNGEEHIVLNQFRILAGYSFYGKIEPGVLSCSKLDGVYLNGQFFPKFVTPR